MPFYRKYGKLLSPISSADFQRLLIEGTFMKLRYKAYFVLLYYTGVRKTEALRALKEQFTITQTHLIFDVLKRLKHGITTPALKIPLAAPGIDSVIKAIDYTAKGKRVFNFSPRTAYNICDRLGFYPHFLRLNRITHFFNSINPVTHEPFTIAQVHTWTGLTPATLSDYIGLVDVSRMGDSLATDKNNLA